MEITKELIAELRKPKNDFPSYLEDLCARAANEIERINFNQWQPIETAPKDGTPLLFANFTSQCLLAGTPHVWAGCYDKFQGDSEAIMIEASFAATNDNGEPTHWMLLPSAPSGK